MREMLSDMMYISKSVEAYRKQRKREMEEDAKKVKCPCCGTNCFELPNKKFVCSVCERTFTKRRK